MKPTSIIFLILSIILIAAGIVTCYAANKIAKQNDIDLFYSASDSENNIIDTHDFSQSEINKITLNLEKTDVYIYGNASESKIILYNFNQNSLTYAQINKIISVDDSGSVLSLFKVTDNGVSFNGLRNLIFSSESEVKDKEKKIEIYISESESIKVFDFKINSGNLVIKDINESADYTLAVSSGNINLHNIVTESKMRIELGKGDIMLKDVDFADANIVLTEGTLSQNIKDNGKLAFDYTVENGTISVNNISKDQSYQITTDEPESKLKATVETGDIILEYND